MRERPPPNLAGKVAFLFEFASVTHSSPQWHALACLYDLYTHKRNRRLRLPDMALPSRLAQARPNWSEESTWSQALRICILIGSPDISGGTYVIFEHALHLQSVGIDVTIVPLTPVSGSTARWHRGLEQLSFKTLEEAAKVHFDLAIATWWKTVYELHRINARQYCHFAQSIETWFYRDHEVVLRNLANAVHLFGLPTLTEAGWIVAHLQKKFGISSYLIPNGCDKQLFRPDGPMEAPRDNHRLRVLVEGPLGVDFKNVARTIALLRKSVADEIWLLTLTAITSYPGVARVWSRQSVADCPRVYRSCDLIVKLSYIEGMFGPPLEMFHCGGTAVVYDVPGHEEYIDTGKNAIVVPLGDEAAAIAAVDQL